MSPTNPQDPQKGKAADTSPEDAAAAKEEAARKPAEQPEPAESGGGTPSAASADEVGRGDERSEAATAAEVTGVDKGAADALAAVGDEEPQAASGDDDPAAAAGEETPAGGEDVPGAEVPSEAPSGGEREREARTVGEDAAEAAAALEADEEPAGEVVAEEPADQQERADAEAARAAAAAEEAAAAAEEAGTPTAEAAAAEAEELAEKAQDAAEEAATKPKRQRSRKAREAEQAADQAEDAAEEATQSARRSRSRRGRGAKPAEEPKAAPRRTPAPVGVTVRAQAKYVRTSARKARLVCDHIRGKDVNEARAILAFTPRGAAKAWSKLLESAVANAEHNHELVGEDLRILSVHADEGPTLKRFRPRAMGRATRIRKRTSHLTITLTPKEL